MTTNISAASATVYQFPARGRFAPAAKREQSNAVGVALPRAARIAVGANWYHDEAIEEEERTRKT